MTGRTGDVRWHLQVMVGARDARGYRPVTVRGIAISQPEGRPSRVCSLPVIAAAETRLADDDLVTALLAGLGPANPLG